RPTRDRRLNDLADCARTVLGHACLDRLRVLTRERPLGSVVRASLRAEDQEATQPRPHVHGPGEATGRVRCLARQRLPLRHASRAVTLQIRHDAPPFPCVVVMCELAVVLTRAGGLDEQSRTGSLRPASGVTGALAAGPARP